MCRRGLRPYVEYYEAESESRNQSAVNPKGELWEQETLQLRVNPPKIDIDNSSVEDATRITVCSANRHGTLVEVMKCFVNLGLLVKRACISSDQDWFADDFYVTEKNAEKVRDPEKLENVRKVLSVEPRRRHANTEGELELEMSGQDRPGLLADMTQLLAGNGYQVKSAAVWTQGISVAFVMTIKRMEHNKNVRFPEPLCQALKKELSGGSDCAVVSPTRCRGHVHHEHRLHFMLLKEAKKREHLHAGVDCSFPEQRTSSKMAVDDVLCKFRSPKLGKPNVSIQPDRRRGYWIINIQCKDRSKLLFDTVCTLADLDFDVYHGSVDCRNEMAELELFVRPRFHHLESIQDRIEEVQRFLEDAITRRFPNGLKLHIHPSNEPECLEAFLHALKAADLCVTRYEAYLSSQVTKKDLYYLEDIEIANQLVELGIRGNGETIPREEFEQRKAAGEKIRAELLNKKSKRLISRGLDLNAYPLLQALQRREEAVRNGKLATIIFIRDFNSKGQEVSGYIDYGHRLQTGSMQKIFHRKKRLLPTPSDLSFYNWNTQTPIFNSTPEFQVQAVMQHAQQETKSVQVVADGDQGMLFKNKRDRKLLSVDPEASPGDNSTRSVIDTEEYLHVVLYDHVTRRRN